MTTALTRAGMLIAAGVPNPTPNLPAAVQTKVDTLLGVIMAIVIAGCVAGVFFCAWKFATAMRHGEAQEVVGRLAGVAAACVLVGTASGFVSFLYA